MAKKKQNKTLQEKIPAVTTAKPNPEFEQAAKAAAAVEQPAVDAGELKKDGRGGARPGAGRPAGTPQDLMDVNRLPTVPNKTLIPVLQIPFDLWATGQQVKELALSKDEAEELALPITQLLEWYFPGKIPEIAWVWLMLLGVTKNIMQPRLALLAKLRKNKTGGKDAVSGSGKQPGNPSSSTQAAPGPLKSYPKVISE